MSIPLLVIFGVTYLLIATEKVDKTIAAVLGAVAAIAGGFIPYEVALHYIDMNVIFLLVGMMMIVNILATTGLFEWIATSIARWAKGNGIVILLLFLTATMSISAFLDNVTTVILIAPITILVCQVLEIPVVPFLILEAVFSNIGGTATLVGDPPNVLIGSQTNIAFNAFLVHLAPVVLVIGGATLGIMYLLLRGKMRVSSSARERILKAEPRLAILEPRKLFPALGISGLVLAGFFLGHFLHVEPGLVALAGGVLMALFCRIELHRILGRVEWNTILFFIGLFMLVGALQEDGLFEWLGQQILRLTAGNLFLTALVILWVSAIASAIVDNIPLVIAMIPLIHSIIPSYAEQMHLTGNAAAIQANVAYPLFWALALGACLGGNGTLVGASANVVISQIARKNNYKLTFGQFAAFGLPLMLGSIVLSTLYLWLRYFSPWRF